MPSYPPRDNPTRKKELVINRSEDLRLAIYHNKSSERICALAEKYRQARLALIKAQFHYSREMSFRGKSGGLDVEKLRTEQRKWEAVTSDEIIAKFKDNIR